MLPEINRKKEEENYRCKRREEKVVLSIDRMERGTC